MESLMFYDLKARKKFYSNNYKIVVKKGRKFAIATNPSGGQSHRLMGRG